MAVNINEAIQSIKRAGSSNVRVVPMDGQDYQAGDHKIEVRNGQAWTTIVSGVKKPMAEDLVSQALNKVILG